MDYVNDFKKLKPDELMDLFHDDEVANEVSSFISSNYSNYRDKILENINSSDPDISEYSIITAARAHDSDAVKHIRKALKSEYFNVVKAALLALGWLWDEDSKDEFYRLIMSGEPEISDAAGASIAMVNDESDISRLEKLSTSNVPHIRRVVAGTLTLINGEKVFRIIKHMLKNENDPAVKRFLVRRISYFNLAEATEILISYLNDPSAPIQEAAAAGLQRTGLRGHEKEVLDKVRSDDIWLSYFAVKALGTGCSDESAKKLIEIYGSKDNNVKLAIIETLGYSGYNSGDFLIGLLKDDNEDIRKESLSALYRLKKKDAAKYAVELFAKDKSWIVRYKALEILDEIKPEDYRDILAMHKDDNKYIQEKIAVLLGGEDVK